MITSSIAQNMISEPGYTAQPEVITKEMIQEKAEGIVNNEIFYCVSSLVSKLSSVDESFYDDFGHLLYCEPSESDYEHAASYEGWVSVKEHLEEGQQRKNLSGYYDLLQENTCITESPENALMLEDCFVKLGDDGIEGEYLYGDWSDVCDYDNIEVDPSEVLEHWIVSEWLARKLQEQGEAIELDLHGVTVWGRCTSGQSICMDYVIEEIAKDILER